MKTIVKSLPKMTACCCLLWAATAQSQALNVQKGDFIQGEFIAQDNEGLDLYVHFQDGSQRRLVHNIIGKRDFMLVAPENGKINFRAINSFNRKNGEQFRIEITQQISLKNQVALPEDYLSPTLGRLAEKIKVNPDDASKLIADFQYQIAQSGTPLIETSSTPNHNLVTFLWFGAKDNVILWGGPTADHTRMQRLPHSDLWFVTFDIPNDTLLSYGFAPDVPILPLDKIAQRRALLATLQQDPLNPHHYPSKNNEVLDKFELRSVLQLEKAPTSEYLQVQNIPHGNVQSYDFHSELLNNSRRIFIYTPANFEPTQDLNLLFFFDGSDYLEKVPTKTILDNMQSAGQLTQTVAVFIDNPSYQTRAAELPPNPVFAQMLAEELYPWVTKKLGIHPQPARTALIGSSYGGLAATYIAMRYPKQFGNLIAMSGSFWWKQPNTPSEQNNYLADYVAKSAQTLPIKFFISAGRFENFGNENSILANSRQLKDVLTAKGYSLTYQEYSSGHDYFAWQTILSDGLKALFEKP